MELGAEHSAVEMFRMVVPIPHQDELPVGGLEQGQGAGQDLGVGGALGFPEESLVAAPGYVKGLELGQSVGCVMDDEDASMGSIIGGVCLCRISKSMPASDLKVLAHGLVLLLVQMGLDHHIDFVVSGPVPIQGSLAESCDVGHIQPHVVLGASRFLGRGVVERWIVIRALWGRQSPGYLPWGEQCGGLDAPDLYDLPSYLWC